MKQLGVVTILATVLGITGLLYAEDHNADIGGQGSQGVPSAWDNESINVLNGNVHLGIPLYSVQSGDTFGFSVSLEHDSQVWDASDLNFPNRPGNRNLIAKSVFGLGWKINFGRVYSLTYASEVTTEGSFYFQGMDGAVHRLYRKYNIQAIGGENRFEDSAIQIARELPKGASPYRVIGKSLCDTNPDAPGCGGTMPPPSYVCVGEPYYYAYDGSGIRAQFDGTSWTVWIPDGTRYQLSHFMDNDLNTPEQASYKGWYTTLVEHAGSLGQSITIDYVDPAVDNSRRYCPLSISDNLRTVTFDCQASLADGTVVDGGVVRSITVPAPHGGTLTYQLEHLVEGVCDPVDYSPDGCAMKRNVLLLNAVFAEGISPLHRFQFDYSKVVNPNPQQGDPLHLIVGDIREVTLPGGAKRTYEYGTYNVWRKHFPIIYNNTSSQFAYFPVRALVSRQLLVGGKTWQWDYQRNNDPGCSSATPQNCYNHPRNCVVSGPYDPSDPAILPSTIVYGYNATKASAGTPSPLDGTLSLISIIAGSQNSGQVLRYTAFSYAYDTPPQSTPTTCNASSFYKDHYADNVRVTSVETAMIDDGKQFHDYRSVSYAGWTMLTANYGQFQEKYEYHPQFPNNPYAIYRKTVTGYALTPAQIDNWVLTPVNWVRILDQHGSTLAETNYTYDDFGRPTSLRKLYSPAPSPMNQTLNDVVSSFIYDSASGNLKQSTTQIAGQVAFFSHVTDAWEYGLPSRQRFGGTDLPLWYTLDVDRDRNTGLPTSVREPWRTGTSIVYDSLGRPASILPLVGSGNSLTTLAYGAGETSTTVGDPALPTSIQGKILFDELGRVKEERILKNDDNGLDQWVARKYELDALGNVSGVSEWAPVGTTGVPATTINRFGTYSTYEGEIQAFDPLFRVRRTVRADGSVITQDYLGLVATTKVQEIQGGTISSPALISSKTTQTFDVYGRLVETNAYDASGASDVFITGAIHSYDELDRLTGSATKQSMSDTTGAQPRTISYDRLGRVPLSNEPERGKIWFGSHSGDGVQPDGYNALGQVVRYQDAAGFASIPAHHYILSYDSAGRSTLVQRETDVSLERTKISEFTYDQVDHGNANSSHLGRLAAMVGYDEAGVAISRTDYFYQDEFGRLNQLKTVLDAWDGISGNLAAGGDVAQSLYYTYNSLNQIATTTYPTSGAPGPSADSTWLSVIRRRGFVTSINSNRGTPIVTNALFNDGGGLKEWDTPTDLKTHLIPDSLLPSRPQEIKVTNFIGTTIWTTGTYSYDGAGLIKSIGADVHRYDALGRLKESQVTGTTAGTFFTQTFSHDTFGNILSKSFSANFDSSTTTTYNVDLGTNRIRGLGTDTSWTYRADGALTRDDFFDYVYDNAGRLLQAKIKGTGTEVGRYYYDGAGLRVARRENHGKEVFSFRDLDGNVLSQFSRPAGTVLTPQWDRDFVYFTGMRVSMIERPLPSAVSWKFSESRNSGGGAGIYLEWSPVPETGIHGYRVYRKASGETAFAPIYAGPNSTVTTNCTSTCTNYLDAGLADHETYIYKVAAVDAAGNEGTASVERTITFKDSTDPPPPENLVAIPGTGSVTLSWYPPSNPPPDFAGFYVYRKTGGSFGTPLNTYPILDHYYYDVSVTNGTTYSYIVKSVDTANLQSSASSEVSATPQAEEDGGGGGGGINPHPRDALRNLPPDLDIPDDGLRTAESVTPLDPRAPSAPYQVVGQATGVRILFLHSDHLGSLRLVTDMSGWIVSDHKYLPFGEEVQPTSSLNPFRYAGYERDAESGMDYVRARFYAPGRGRWLTPDPLGASFTYSSNSPTNRFDPTGMMDAAVCNAGEPGCQATGLGYVGVGAHGGMSDLNRMIYDLMRFHDFSSGGGTGGDDGGGPGGGGGKGGTGKQKSRSTICGDMQKTGFVADNYSAAANAAANLNTDPSFLLGLAAHESAYGTSQVAQQANNFFGLTAGPGFSGTNGTYTLGAATYGSYSGRGIENSLASFAGSVHGRRVSGASTAQAFISGLTSPDFRFTRVGAFNKFPSYPGVLEGVIAEVQSILNCP